MLRIALFLLAVVTASACNPKDCQGGGFNGQNVQKGIDSGAPSNIGNALCPNNNTTSNGDVNITNQTELNQVKNCKIIVGNVFIHDSTDIKDLSPLATLTTINQGYFLAFNNSALTDIEMPALQQAAFGIGVVQNASLTAANFPGVVEALGDITIRANPNLTQVGFPALQRIKDDANFAGKAQNAGNLIVVDNPKLTGFSTFTNLDEIFGFFQLAGCDAVQDFTGLEKLQKIDNDGKAAQALAIGIDFDDANDIIPDGNKTLKNLTGFDILDTIANGDVFIGFNAGMQNMKGMQNVKTLTNNLFVVGNDSLQNLDGLQGDGNNDGVNDGLQTVNGSIFIGQFFDAFKQPRPAGNGQLTDLTGLNSLTQLDGSLVVAFNDSLKDFTGLDNLPTIGKDLVVAGATMNDFSGAKVLSEIKGSFVMGQFFGNDDQVLSQLFDAGPDGLFNTADDVAHDPALIVQNLDADNANNTALPALTTIDGNVIVAFSNPKSLRIADALTTVGGSLIVHDSNLTDLTGFESVSSLGGLVVGFAIDKDGNLHVGGNNSFDSFNGLNAANVGAGGIAIGNNAQLTAFASLGVAATTGSVTIGNENVTNLNDFNITAIGKDLNIGAIVNGNDNPVDDDLPNLTALQLNNLLNVGGNVLVAFNPKLTDVGFSALQTVTGKFEIANEGQLTTINGSNQLGQVGDLRLHDLPALTTIDLATLNKVNNDLFLVNDPQLQTLTLTGLGQVVGNANLQFLGNLNTLDGVNNLAQVGGSLVITDDANIADTQGLNKLANVGGDFILARLGSVTTLTLNSLATVGGSFDLTGDDGLTDLTDASPGTSCTTSGDCGGGQVCVGASAAVNGTCHTSLPLGSVGDTLRIQDNAHIASLVGLENLATVGLAIAVDNNPLLDTVLVDAGNRHQLDQQGDLGLVALASVGDANPVLVGQTGNNAQGDRGAIEAQNNPKLDEQQLDTLISGLTGNQRFFTGCDATSLQNGTSQQCGVFFCGNLNQLPGSTNVDPTFDSPTCGAAQAGAEGEGEGGQ